MNEIDAEKLACPYQKRSDDVAWNCVGSQCMAWRSTDNADSIKAERPPSGYCKLTKG